MSRNYFICLRCDHIHDCDPRPDLAVSSSGQESGFSTRQPEFDSPHRYQTVAAPLHEAPHPDTDQLMQCLQRQLDAVDRAVGFPHEDGKGRIQLIDELKAPAACVCSVPDFIGYVGEPEHWRCLLCGRQPSTTETIHVRLFKRPGLHEAPHPPQAQQWQSIDTAPKDGTEILLLEDRRIVNGSWNRGGAMHMPHWMGGLFHPTHWQPTIALPLSPPTQETK